MVVLLFFSCGKVGLFSLGMNQSLTQKEFGRATFWGSCRLFHVDTPVACTAQFVISAKGLDTESTTQRLKGGVAASLRLNMVVVGGS